MHRVLYALGALLFLGAVRCTADTGGLISNSSFETVVKGKATGWASYYSGYVVDSTVSHTSTHSISCTNTTLSDSRGAYYNVTLNQAAASPIKVDGWSKASHVAET